MNAPRLSYEESCRLLIRLGILRARDDNGGIPVMPDVRPQPGDELQHGIRFFRTWVGSGRPVGLQSPPDFVSDIKESDLENLTLPRTFFGRSEISHISFSNTDLSESTLCWNDFIEVDFTDADLSRSDLRASIFERTNFIRTILRNADLRCTSFKECDFTDADLRGAKLIHAQGKVMPLSDMQKQQIDWHEVAGDQPDGG